MAGWVAAPGQTLLRPSGSKNHLYVILLVDVVLDQFGYGASPKLVMVNATTIRDGVPHDTACCLAPGCHPFIGDPSYMRYRDAVIEDVQHVTSMVNQGVWPGHQPTAAGVLTQILSGVCVSALVRRELKRIFNCP